MAGPPVVINAMGVAVDRKDKKRAVVDGRYVNLFLRYMKFCYEGLGDVFAHLERDDFMYTIDFKSGYHQVRHVA